MSKMVQDYMLMDVIGSGQYGKVWKAQHIKTREPFAIKAISIQEISKLAKLKEFVMSEINALELMSNRNIVKYYGKLQTQNNIYLIFEYCRGGTLEEVIKKEGSMPEFKALAFFDHILNAFSELHRLNIMHRDLKPSNVLLEGGEAKLADFGFCKKLNGEFEMTKSIVGSPIYMAPELLQGRYYCRKADIWSLGVMLYEMLHGKCPYEENSIPSLLEKIKTTELRIMPSLSLETKHLLQSMLTFDPSSRINWTDLFKRLSNSSPIRAQISTTYAFTNLTVSSLGDQSTLNMTHDLALNSSLMHDNLGSRYNKLASVIPTSDFIRQRSQSRNQHDGENVSPRKPVTLQTYNNDKGLDYGLSEAARLSSPQSTPKATHLTSNQGIDMTR
jgi:serine/threonine protein kinase